MEKLFSELLKEKQNLEAQCVELESQNKIKTLMFQRETSIFSVKAGNSMKLGQNSKVEN